MGRRDICEASEERADEPPLNGRIPSVAGREGALDDGVDVYRHEHPGVDLRLGGAEPGVADHGVGRLVEPRLEVRLEGRRRVGQGRAGWARVGRRGAGLGRLGRSGAGLRRPQPARSDRLGAGDECGGQASSRYISRRSLHEPLRGAPAHRRRLAPLRSHADRCGDDACGSVPTLTREYVDHRQALDQRAKARRHRQCIGRRQRGEFHRALGAVAARGLPGRDDDRSPLRIHGRPRDASSWPVGARARSVTARR